MQVIRKTFQRLMWRPKLTMIVHSRGDRRKGAVVEGLSDVIMDAVLQSSRIFATGSKWQRKKANTSSKSINPISAWSTKRFLVLESIRLSAFVDFFFLLSSFLNIFTAGIDMSIEDAKRLLIDDSCAIFFPEALMERPDVHLEIIFPTPDLLRCLLLLFLSKKHITGGPL